LNDDNGKKSLFSGKFLFRPCQFYLILNIVAFLGLCCVGFLFFNIFNINSSKKFGDYCKIDSDCEQSMNYLCMNHVCSCEMGTFFVRAGLPCGKLKKLIQL